MLDMNASSGLLLLRILLPLLEKVLGAYSLEEFLASYTMMIDDTLVTATIQKMPVAHHTA